ncbi:MAG TPA: hypothetical protein VEP89_08085 [Draconibacterium sp.]|nr:hypothetical protein [Draconibacterium sp.]
MRSKNLNVMKTKNNVQKTILRSAAVIISFILISFTVSAQTFWQRLLENTGFKDIVMVMVSQDDNEETGVNNASSVVYNSALNVDPALELEAWMMDESRFDGKQKAPDYFK